MNEAATLVRSEAARPDERSEQPAPHVWRRFATAFLAVLFGGLGSIYAFLVVVDPYDTGRFPSPLKPGVLGSCAASFEV